MTFVAMFFLALAIIAVWKIGSRVGRYVGQKEAEEKARKKGGKTLAEMTEVWDRATKQRAVTLIGSPISGQVVRFSELELKAHDYKLQITAVLPDASEFVGVFQVQGDVGLFVDEEVAP